MNEETQVTLGASVISLVIGYAVRYWQHLNAIPAPSPYPVPVPAPVPVPSSLESRLDALEKQLAALIAALSRPQTPAAPAS